MHFGFYSIDCGEMTLSLQTPEGFGFNVMGGKEQKCPIYISRIIPGGYADKQGTIRRGDQLLSVNGEVIKNPVFFKCLH